MILTPHNSGETQHTLVGRLRDIGENIQRLYDGRPLLNVVWPAAE